MSSTTLKESITTVLPLSVQSQKMLPMITNSLGLFGLLRVRTEAPKKRQVISFCLCLTVHIKDAKHTHKQNQQSRLCKSLLGQNTCLKSMEEVVQILHHMSNLFNFFPESN